MDKKTEHEMETGVMGFIGGYIRAKPKLRPFEYHLARMRFNWGIGVPKSRIRKQVFVDIHKIVDPITATL